ncbi:unnamed protein product, partial [Amoebophrya sp. A120]
GHHWIQLAAVDEVRNTMFASAEEFKRWGHDLYVFTRKLVYHKCDLLEDLEAWAAECFSTPGISSNASGSYTMVGNSTPVDSGDDALFRILSECIQGREDSN